MKISKKKKNDLNNNIKILEDITNNLEQSLNELKTIFLKITENKDSLKLKVQKLFTKIRNAINEREDKLLLEIDNQFNNLFFKEEEIKECQKLSDKIKTLITKGKNNK